MKKNYCKQFILSLTLVLLANIKMYSQIGESLRLDGINDYILTSDFGSAMDNTKTGITIEAWVWAEGPGIVVTELGQTTINTAWHDSQIEILPSGNTYVRVWPIGSVFIGNITFFTWNHVVMRYNILSSKLDGLLNGVPSGGSVTGARANPYNNYSGHCYYGLGATDGTNLGSGAYFKGKIDEVRFWNVARTNCQIKSYMKCEIPSNAPGLVANYHFNQGIDGGANPSENLLYDDSGSSITGTLNNFNLSGATSNWVSPGGVLTGSITPAMPTIVGGPLTVNSGSICAGNSFTIIPNSGPSYTVSPGGSSIVTPASTSSYTVSALIGTDGCLLSPSVAVSNVTVVSLPLPVVTLTASATVLCASEELILTASGTATTYKWSMGGVGSKYGFYPTTTATYTVYGYDNNGCYNTAVISATVNNCTAIEELNSNNLLSVYPNPSNGEFFLDVNTENTIVTIFDAIGNTIYSEKLNSGKHQINLNNQSAGLYFIQAKNNDRTYSTRLIKQ